MIKITTPSGYQFEVDDMDTAVTVLKSLENGHLPSQHAAIPTPRKSTHPDHGDRSSRYYSVKRARNTIAIRDTYEYVAKFVNGRSVEQVAEHFYGEAATTENRMMASSRLQSLMKDGLLERVTRGHYKATA